MDGLVLELQKDALNPSMSLNDLLRKALVVAKKLGIAEFQSWIEKESRGYSSDDDIPSYRNVKGVIKAHNPYHGWIPVIIEDENLAKALQNRRVSQSVADMSSLVKRGEDNDNDGNLHINYSPKIQATLMRDGLGLVPVLHIGCNSLCGILDTIKNIVLEWSLKLEEQGVIGEGMSFSEEEKGKARDVQNINIGNFQGNIGDITESMVTQNLEMNISTGDFESLSKYLKSKGLEDDDIEALKGAIDEDPAPSGKQKFGAKVSGWIGKMVSKAAAGVWNIGAGAAGSVLTKALCSYFGM